MPSYYSPPGMGSGSGGPVPASSGGIPGQNVPTNLGAIPGIDQLTKMLNDINIRAQQEANLGRIPGGAGLEAKSSENIGNLLGGNVPPDVLRNLQIQAAERGVATGMTGGSDVENTNAAYLRALGLTSLGLQEQGQRDLTSALGRNPVAHLYDPSQQILSAAQAAQLAEENNRLALAWWLAVNRGQGQGGGGGGGGNPFSGVWTGGPTYFDPTRGGGGTTTGTAGPSGPGGIIPGSEDDIDPWGMGWGNLPGGGEWQAGEPWYGGAAPDFPFQPLPGSELYPGGVTSQDTSGWQAGELYPGG